MKLGAGAVGVLIISAGLVLGCDKGVVTTPFAMGGGSSGDSGQNAVAASGGSAGIEGSGGSGEASGGAGAGGTATAGAGGANEVTPPTHASLQVVSGDQHFCSRGEDSQVLCWGDLGDGVASESRNMGLAGVQYLASGTTRTCASDLLMHVYCWDGVLGEPEQFGALNFGNRLMVNDDAACALDMIFDTNSELYCWGTTAGGSIHEEPMLVTRPPGSIRKLQGGYGTFSVLFNDGYLWAPSEWSTPREIPYGFETSDVTVSMSHECRLSSSGTVWCSQLPDQHFTKLGLQELDLVSLAAGDAFTCGLSSTGAVYCSGLNLLGQLGDGTRNSRSDWAAVNDLPPAVEISAGRAHVCARSNDGAITCWGLVPSFGEQLVPLYISGTGGGSAEIPSLQRIAPSAVGAFAEAAISLGTSMCECALPPGADPDPTPSCIREEGARFNFRCLRSLEANVDAMTWLTCKTTELDQNSTCWRDYCDVQCPLTPQPCEDPEESFVAACGPRNSCTQALLTITPDIMCDGFNTCGLDEMNCAAP